MSDPIHHGTHRAGRHWSRWLLGLPALVIIAVIAYGAIVAFVINPPSGGTEVTTLTTGEDPSPTPTPHAVLTPEPTIEVTQVPVDPNCWAARDSAEVAGCQTAVATKTKFVDRYRSHQAELAAKHTVVRAGPIGTREANSLSRHGLLICWMVKEQNVSLETMVTAFTFAMHPHQYKLPPVPQGVNAPSKEWYAATQIHVDALQTICPSLADEYQDKGGPVIADLT